MYIKNNHSWMLDYLFLTLVLGSLFFIFLGMRPLSVPDEGNYAEIVREMAASKDYVTPYLNDIQFFEKPILLYWLGTLAVKLGGLNLWSIRSVNALLGLFTCLLTYFAARKCYDRKTGLLAAIILGTNVLFFILAHMLTTDLTVTAFMTATLYCFLLGCEHPPGDTRCLYFISAATAAGLAVLSKGLIGIVLPVMIISVWIALFNEWRQLKNAYIMASVAVFLIITIPWHAVVQWYHPEFFHFYFTEQHFHRFATQLVGHPQPMWFFIPLLAAGFFPWIVFMPQAIYSLVRCHWKERHQYKSSFFFLLWAAIIFIFFSIGTSKLISYILPVFPPLSILTAYYILKQIEQKNIRGMRAGFIAFVLASLFIAYVLCTLTQHYMVADVDMTMLFLRSASVVLILGSVIGLWYVKKSAYKAFILMIGTSSLFLLVMIAALPFVDSLSIRPLADRIKPILQPQDEVVAFNHHFQDISFYLERRIHILNSRKLFRFGMKHQADHQWMINDLKFNELWHSQKRVFAFMHNEDYAKAHETYPDCQFYVWGKTARNTLVSNQPSLSPVPTAKSDPLITIV